MKISEKRLKEELLKTTNIIRRKYQDLHKHRLDVDEKQRENFKVILDPLDEIISKNEKLLQSRPKNHFFPISQLETSGNNEKMEEFENETSEFSKNFNRDHHSGFVNDNHDEITPHNNMNTAKFGDPVYGIKKQRDSYYIGNNVVEIKNGNLLIDNQTYRLTNGLQSLLLTRKPDPGTYTDNDLTTYKDILQQTNAHERKSRRHKYEKIIKPLFKAGSGLQSTRYKVNNLSLPEYTYWDDPNELVTRLQLLIGSTEAGHNGHSNEIISIIEELKEASFIE